MRETRSSGSVRGASGDGRPYRERISTIAVRPGEGRLTEPTAAVPAWWPELAFMAPHFCHYRAGNGSVGWKGGDIS
jgi:hypothetical protein